MTGTKKTDQTRERQFKDFSGKAGAVFTNSLGLLSAFGIAFGGLFLVYHRLVREENAILDRGGRVEVLVQSEAVAAQEAGEEISVQAPLTESQLYRVVEKLETETEGAVPHEPWENQLSLAEAAVCGREWVESFLLPKIGNGDYELTECKTDCSLWAWRTDVEAGVTDPEFSYWTVCMDAWDLRVRLILNAVTGQVLSAYVSSTLLVEYQDEDRVQELLYAYADSFGIEEKYIIYMEGEENGLWAISRNGSEGIHASVETASFAIVSAENGSAQAKPEELFTIELRLGTN